MLLTELFNLVQTNPWNANVYAKGSLRQLSGNYSLVIQVNDLGSPMHTVEAKIIIRVLDVNDNAPVFLTSNKTIRVAEVIDMKNHIKETKTLTKCIIYRMLRSVLK